MSNLAADNGYSERLDATIAAGGAISAGGSISLLAAGATSSALHVGVDTGSSGLKSGAATATLASDGSRTSGLGALAPGRQAAQASGKTPSAPAFVRRGYLLRGVPVTRSNQVWSTDVTCIRLARGFACLVATCLVRDSPRPPGWRPSTAAG